MRQLAPDCARYRDCLDAIAPAGAVPTTACPKRK